MVAHRKPEINKVIVVAELARQKKSKASFATTAAKSIERGSNDETFHVNADSCASCIATDFSAGRV